MTLPDELLWQAKKIKLRDYFNVLSIYWYQFINFLSIYIHTEKYYTASWAFRNLTHPYNYHWDNETEHYRDPRIPSYNSFQLIQLPDKDIYHSDFHHSLFLPSFVLNISDIKCTLLCLASYVGLINTLASNCILLILSII